MTDSLREPKGSTSSNIANAHVLLGQAIESALTNLKNSADLGEVERALNVIKIQSEIQKIDTDRIKAEQDTKKVAIDASLASKQQRHALLGSMVAPLVPLASLLTVIVTLFVSNQQIHITRNQALQKAEEDKIIREEANWKAFEDDISKSEPDVLYSSGVFASRLRGFSLIERRKLQLFDITKHFMIGLSSASAFQDMWKIAFKETNANNFDDVVELARAKKQQFDRLAADCNAIRFSSSSLAEDTTWKYLGLCSPKYSVEDLVKENLDSDTLQKVLSLKESTTHISTVQQFLGNQIADYIRVSSNKQNGVKDFDISNMSFVYANFDNVDFSKANLTQTILSTCSINGAILTPKAVTYAFPGTPWWEVDSIDQKSLPYLLTYYYPEIPSVIYPTDYKITREQYERKIGKLCIGDKIFCSSKCLRFGSAPSSIPPECEVGQ